MKKCTKCGKVRNKSKVFFYNDFMSKKEVSVCCYKQVVDVVLLDEKKIYKNSKVAKRELETIVDENLELKERLKSLDVLERCINNIKKELKE